MFDDLRRSIRSLARAKTLAAVLLVSLALGTGANAALFSVLDALIFDAPAGVARPERLVSVYTSRFNGASHGLSSYPDYLDVKRSAGAFESIAAYHAQSVETVRIGASIHRARVAAVSDEFFGVLGMTPHVGEVAGFGAGRSPQTAMISLKLWRSLGASPGILGETLNVAGTDYVIAAVAPARFHGLELGRMCDVWIPLGQQSDRGDRRLSLIGRLRPSAGVPDARRDVEAIATALADRYPETNRGTMHDPEAPRRMTARPYSQLDSAARAQASLIAALVFGATALLLLSACVNAGSLLLSRAASRGRELAVKVALGASRERLMRELLIESLVVSVAGGALGLLFAVWTARVLPALFAPEHVEMLDTTLDLRVVLLTVGVSCVAGVLFGLAPASRATRTDAATALRGDAGGISDARGGRLRSVLVVCQVALSTVLLIATTVMVQSFAAALTADFGFRTKEVAVMSIETPGGPRDLPRDQLKGVRFLANAAEAMKKVEGAGAAGWVAALPLLRTESQQFRIRTAARPGVTETIEPEVNAASPGYFKALWMPAIEGRLIDDGDTALSDPVVVVNDVLAARYFGRSPVGEYLLDPEGTALKIVGVVRSGKYRTLQEEPRPTVYYPLAQRYQEQLNLVVRTSGDPQDVLDRIATRFVEIDRGVSILKTTTLERHLSEALVLDRLTLTLIGACGIVALALAIVGVYGVIGDAVRRRTREIGIRVALGAGPLRIVRLVFGEGVHLAVAGVVGGIGLAAIFARLAQSFVDGIPPLEPAALAMIPLSLTVVVVLAAAVPTTRALRVKPMVALRDE